MTSDQKMPPMPTKGLVIRAWCGNEWIQLHYGSLDCTDTDPMERLAHDIESRVEMMDAGWSHHPGATFDGDAYDANVATSWSERDQLSRDHRG